MEINAMKKFILPKPTEAAKRKRQIKKSKVGVGVPVNTRDTIYPDGFSKDMYQGRVGRNMKYQEYDRMDSDSDISRALDIIAEHCSEKNDSGNHFHFKWGTDFVGYGTSEIVQKHLEHWESINKWDKRLSNVIRNVVKYGDFFLFRNPYTFELFELHPRDVQGAIVDKETLEIVGWAIRNFRFNVEDLEIDSGWDIKGSAGLDSSNGKLGSNSGENGVFRYIPAKHIVHLSTSTGKSATVGGMFGSSGIWEGNAWPFGNSWLDKVVVTHNQRKMIEDAAIIHRLHRAPQRHVFFYDTGRARGDRAEYMVEKFKNEIIQKRIPMRELTDSVSSPTMSIGVDGVYNPMSQLEDIFIPTSFEQQGSRIEKLEGQPWTDIPELEYFKQKLAAALRVPYAWLQAGSNGVIPSDGKLGVATQEELEFSRFCIQLQRLLHEEFDKEFKRYIIWRGLNISVGDFTIELTPPTDYQASRNRARLNESIDSFKNMIDVPFISKRLAMAKVLGWSEDEIALNEKMVMEETHGDVEDVAIDSTAPVGSFGIEPPSFNAGGMMPEEGTDMNDMGNEFEGNAPSGDLMNDIASEGFDMKLSDFEIPLYEGDGKLDIPKKINQMQYDPDYNERIPDGMFNSFDPIRQGKRFSIKLRDIQKYRMRMFTKTVDWKNRKKAIQKVYGAPDSGGGSPF